MENLSQHVEAIIFTSDQPVTEKDIIEWMNKVYGFEFDEEQVKKLLDEINERYQSKDVAMELVKAGGGYQFLTKAEFHPTISGFLNTKSKKKLSNAAMETLAIISYKQPVTKTDLEQIRGVNCDYSVQKLLEKELIEIQGRQEGPGKPLLYGTSQAFMDYFGINSMDDLPKLKELEQPNDNEIGNPTD